MTGNNVRHLFAPDLIARYDRPGPRYTSYPTAVQFHDEFGETHYRAAARASNTAPLSIYVHLPFCDTVCFYCACSKIVTRNRSHAAPYLADLEREIALQAELFGARPVQQLHWGGGTPTFLSGAEMRGLMTALRRRFPMQDGGEYSIEIDPRAVGADTLALLRELGFNRLSLGVQDFDPYVQRAVNRIQSKEQTLAVLDRARTLGFRSINLDLIYGLPKQTVESFDRTLDVVIAAAPERLSVFSYAHIPELFKTQRQIVAADLPASGIKLEILQHTVERLTAAGYLYIGMDHFARPDDELALAQREGTLHRNFQGYSTHAECDLLGLGITAIGHVGQTYSQNHKNFAEYSAAVNAGRLPVRRGIELGDDDRLRRAVIGKLICHFHLDIPDVEREFGIAFAAYFEQELRELALMQDDGLLRLAPTMISVEPVGKFLIRTICMVFDRYLRPNRSSRFSKTI